MNQLEKAIIDGVWTAQRQYQKMTDGWWLSHGPESFIEHFVAVAVARKGFSVYPEASPKKIMKEFDTPPRGRPANNFGQRFDIVVWLKSAEEVKAIIEIKRAWSIKSLRVDRRKVATFLRQGHARAGYLLAYTEAKSEAKLQEHLKYWAYELNCKLVGRHIDSQEDEKWQWAIGLFKVRAER
jgi:hypothetical protein